MLFRRTSAGTARAGRWSGRGPGPRAVRQQQDDARALPPLGLARGDELVDDQLRAVDEVAELRLPQHQRVGAGHRVAVLEADRGVLAEQRVVDEEPGLVLGRFAIGVYSFASSRSMSTEWRCTKVPRRESWPASRTGNALHEQRPEGQQLAHRPVDAALADHGGAALEHLLQLGVDGEVLRQRDVRVADGLEHLGVMAVWPTRRAAGRPGAPAWRILGVVGLGEGPLELPRGSPSGPPRPRPG